MSMIFIGLSIEETEELNTIGHKRLGDISEKEYSRYQELLKRTLDATKEVDDSCQE